MKLNNLSSVLPGQKIDPLWKIETGTHLRENNVIVMG